MQRESDNLSAQLQREALGGLDATNLCIPRAADAAVGRILRARWRRRSGAQAARLARTPGTTTISAVGTYVPFDSPQTALWRHRQVKGFGSRFFRAAFRRLEWKTACVLFRL